jgi:TPR repeat protein
MSLLALVGWCGADALAAPATAPSTRRSAATTGQADAFDELRRAWYAGGQHGMPKPEAIARMRAHYDAHPNDPEGLWWMAILQKQSLVQTDKTTAELFATAALGGQPIAIARLGRSLLTGEGVKADPEKGLRILNELLAKGETEAAFELGRAYLDGAGTIAPDPAKAEQYLRQAAETGDARGRYLLGQWYARIRRDFPSAFKEFEQAARDGNTDAMANLVEGYRDGKGGIAMNPKLALFWMEKGARAGKVSLQRDLAKALISKYGNVALTAQNRQAARLLLELAVKSNDTEAMRILAEQYLTAELGYDYDPTKAIDLLQRASDMKDMEAMLELGKLHIEGIVLPRDVTKGMQLVRAAADGGCEPAKRYYVRLALPKPTTVRDDR